MKINRVVSLGGVFFLIVCLVLTTVLVDNKTITTLAGFKSDKTIILDAGHGGTDNGSRGPSGTYEKEHTLAIALCLRDILEENGASVVMTRSSDHPQAISFRHGTYPYH